MKKNNINNSRIYYLDFIRSLAIVIIIIYHFNCAIVADNINTFHYIFYENLFVSWGVIGVKLFLMVSGAALMYKYNNTLILTDFYKKRIESIIPLFYISYVVAFIGRYFILKYSIPDISVFKFIFTLLGFDGYLSQISPMFNLVGDWFIGVILIYYGIFPILRFMIKKNSILTLFLSIFCLLISVYLQPFFIDPSCSILGNLFPFVFGMIFGYNKDIILKNKIYLLIIILFLFTFNKIFISISISIGIFIILYIVGSKMKRSSIIYYISKYSYAMFLLHHIIISVVLNKFSGANLPFFITLIILIICFIVTYFSSVVLVFAKNKIS